MKAQKVGVKVYLYFFFNLGTRRQWMVNKTPRPLCPRETKRNTQQKYQKKVWNYVSSAETMQTAP
jgi:hypothetical protein